MKKTISLMFIIIFSLSFCLANDKEKSYYVYLQDPNDLINPQNFYEYRIIKNDHLSHLSYKFYHDGLKWKKIYKANPYIIDPNWIYPDNWLVIPDMFTDENGNPIAKEQSFVYLANEYQNQTDNIESKIDTITVETNVLPEDESLSIDDTMITTSYPENPKVYVVKQSDQSQKSSIDKTTTNKNPNWVIGIFGGYPFGDIPDEENNLDFGLLIGTPLRVAFGPLSARLGAGFLGFDFTDKLYPGAGVLLNLSISELLKFTTPLQLQIHGTGFYVSGGGIGTGVIGSTSVPIGNSPFNIGLYVGIGEYNTSDSVKSNWKNTGIMLQLQF